MKFIGGGRVVGGGVGVGDGWEAGGKQQCCMFSSAQKLPQSTWFN